MAEQLGLNTREPPRIHAGPDRPPAGGNGTHPHGKGGGSNYPCATQHRPLRRLKQWPQDVLGLAGSPAGSTTSLKAASGAARSSTRRCSSTREPNTGASSTPSTVRSTRHAATPLAPALQLSWVPGGGWWQGCRRLRRLPAPRPPATSSSTASIPHSSPLLPTLPSLFPHSSPLFRLAYEPKNRRCACVAAVQGSTSGMQSRPAAARRALKSLSRSRAAAPTAPEPTADPSSTGRARHPVYYTLGSQLPRVL